MLGMLASFTGHCHVLSQVEHSVDGWFLFRSSNATGPPQPMATRATGELHAVYYGPVVEATQEVVIQLPSFSYVPAMHARADKSRAI